MRYNKVLAMQFQSQGKSECVCVKSINIFIHNRIISLYSLSYPHFLYNICKRSNVCLFVQEEAVEIRPIPDCPKEHMGDRILIRCANIKYDTHAHTP